MWPTLINTQWSVQDVLQRVDMNEQPQLFDFGGGVRTPRFPSTWRKVLRREHLQTMQIMTRVIDLSMSWIIWLSRQLTSRVDVIPSGVFPTQICCFEFYPMTWSLRRLSTWRSHPISMLEIPQANSTENISHLFPWDLPIYYPPLYTRHLTQTII